MSFSPPYFFYYQFVPLGTLQWFLVLDAHTCIELLDGIQETNCTDTLALHRSYELVVYETGGRLLPP